MCASCVECVCMWSLCTFYACVSVDRWYRCVTIAIEWSVGAKFIDSAVFDEKWTYTIETFSNIRFSWIWQRNSIFMANFRWISMLFKNVYSHVMTLMISIVFFSLSLRTNFLKVQINEYLGNRLILCKSFWRLIVINPNLIIKWQMSINNWTIE